MNKDVLVRRFFHCLIALAPLYFVLPVDLPLIGLRRWVLLIGFFVVIGVFDFWRRRKGVTFLGLRPHEKEGTASYVWAVAGITFVLWLIPQDIATAALVSMALVDPLSGELRARYSGPLLPIVAACGVYFLMAVLIMGAWADRTVSLSIILGAVGTAVAIPSEILTTKFMDDDFTMLVFPAIAMNLAAVLM